MASIAGIVLVCLVASDAYSQAAAMRDLAAAKQVVEQLRELPTPLPIVGVGVHPEGEPIPIPRSEVIRDYAYRDLNRLGAAGIAALEMAYSDPDVRLRRNVALAFNFLAGGYWPGLSKLDVSTALPTLITALTDDDADVRAWSAQAIGAVGEDAGPAVPYLIALLSDEDEGSRNSACVALRGIGPAARTALPALRRALSDPSEDVRTFARNAIVAIER